MPASPRTSVLSPAPLALALLATLSLLTPPASSAARPKGDLPSVVESAVGSVVNISSGFGKMAAVGSIPYGGAKAAQEQATRQLAVEFSPQIRVNAIRVGAITTENMKQNLLEVMPGIGEKLSAWTPVGRLGEPEDIAAAVVYLGTSASSYVTGRVVDVDGGMVMERSLLDIIAQSEKMQR